MMYLERKLNDIILKRWECFYKFFLKKLKSKIGSSSFELFNSKVNQLAIQSLMKMNYLSFSPLYFNSKHFLEIHKNCRPYLWKKNKCYHEIESLNFFVYINSLTNLISVNQNLSNSLIVLTDHVLFVRFKMVNVFKPLLSVYMVSSSIMIKKNLWFWKSR